MSVLNINSEDCVECPLCMEPLEMDDLSFFPCTCGYQICRFCWHRIRTDENGLCPACRKAYPENPADFKPLSTEEIQRIKAEKRQKDQQKKQKATENRKHLANVRVVQRNLVFVVGLSPKLADPEVLKRAEYFGKFGKIHKVVINHSTQYAGSQGPSASAYVTYVRGEDALRAIQSVNNIVVDGRTLRASLGTTKYCSHFMKNQICPKPDCMYLHEIGDDSASFTKEEMQQGKHTDYERMLLDQLFLLTNNKERRKTSTSPPLQGATPGPQAVSKDAWPSLPPGNTGNSSNSSAKGSAGPGAVKPEAAAPPPPAAAAKEKRGKSKAATQATTTASGGGSGEPSHVEEAKVVTAQPRKTKEKQKATPPPTETPLQTQQTQTQTNVTNHNRQRSDSRSPALSSSSNPTPPPLTSSSSPVSSQENGFAPVNHLQSQIQILHQGACMAAEEEAIDRARDEAENFPAAPTNRDASTFARAMMDNSNNHSFFSTGPIAAVSARSNGQSLAGCWLADGAEEGSVRSSLPDQSASDLRSVKQNSNPGAVESGYPPKSADDDLGFDPFHETQKALAEMLEKESISAASNYGNPNQVSYSNSNLYSSSQSPHQNLTRQSPGLGLGLGLNLGMALSASQQQQQQQQPLRTRVPPPGFTPAQMGMPGVNQNSFGLSLPNMGLGLANRPSGMSEYGSSKMLPFMNHSASNGSTGSSSLGPRLFPDASNMGYGNSGFGMNYGMGVGNMGMVSSQSGSANKNQGFGMGLNSSLPFLNNSSGSSLGGLSGGAGGLGDPSGLKDWQDGLRGFFGSNNSSAVNPTNRSAMGAFPPGMNSQPANSGPSLPQTMNKSWRSSVPDWAALDPAIITSGQLSDSRSDSPPHWLRSLEQLTETAPVQSAAASQSNMFGLPSSHYFAAGMNRPAASGLDPLSQQQSTSFWPSGSMSASMPPPGFSHLRPPTKTAAADTHKLLDNL